MDSGDNHSPARLAADVLTAYIRRNTVPSNELPALARELRLAFTDTLQGEALANSGAPSKDVDSPSVETVDEAAPSLLPRRPIVPINQSVYDDYLISLEDGKHYRSLRRHLMAKYGMTPDDYRAKWNLPADYPMVAPSYARDRSEVARRSGLGLSSSARRGAAPKRA